MATYNVGYTLVLANGVAYQNSVGGQIVSLDGLSYADGIWTMNDFNFTTSADTALKIAGDAETTITVTGENSIKGGDASTMFGGTLGAYVDVETNLQGTGSLTIESGEPAMSGSDMEIGKDLSIQGITLTLTSRCDNRSISLGTFVKDSATLTVEDATVNVWSGLTIRENANTTVNGTGTITVDGHVKGVTGSSGPQAAAHDSDGNELTWDDTEGCYKKEDGTKVTTKIVLTAAGPTIADATVTLGETEYTYAGTAFAPTVTVTWVDGTVLTQDTDYTLTYADNVDAGTATVTVKGINAYTGKKDATFTIAQREVTLTSASDTKIYDETPLTNSTVEVGGDGWAEGEGATYTVTGSQTVVGSSANTFTYTLNENTKASNYSITKTEGTLSVTQLDKNTYDAMIADPEFVYPEEKGALKVYYVTGNALRTNDIDTLMAKEGVNNVAFQQDLIDIRKLTLKDAGVTKTIAFRDAYGTTKSDTIRFAKNSSVVFGQAGYEINLEEGSNKLQIDKNAKATVYSNLTNVSTVKAARESVVATGDIKFQAGRNASLKAEGSYFEAGTITGIDKKTSLTIGKGTEFVSKAVTLADKADKFTTGKDSKVYIGTCSGDVFTGAALNFNGGNDKLTIGKNSGFAAGDILFGSGNDTLKIESSSNVNLSGLLDFGDGKDSLSIGKGSVLSVNELDVLNLDKLSMGKDSKLVIADADDLAAAKAKWAKYDTQIVAKAI